MQKEVQQVSVRHKAEVLVVGGISRRKETCSTCPGQILSDLKSGSETAQYLPQHSGLKSVEMLHLWKGFNSAISGQAHPSSTC